MKRQVLSLAAMAMALAGIAAACGTDDRGSQPTSTAAPTANSEEQARQARLDSTRSRWEARDFHSYEFDFRWTCWCFFASGNIVRIRVDDGKVTSVTNPVTGEPVPEPMYEVNRYMTVDELFDWIETQIEIPANELTVEYSGDFSYPTRANSDPYPGVLDDERSFLISRFEPNP